MKHFLTKHHFKIINTICYVAFLLQLFKIIHESIYPTQKTTDIEETKIDDFPIIFKICGKPGFNLSALQEKGYLDVFDYFLGESMFNSSVYGWAGHSPTHDVKWTVEEIYGKVVLHQNIQEVVSR